MKTQLLSLAAAVLLLASCDNMSKSEANSKETLADATPDTAVVARTGADAATVASNAADEAGAAVSNTWDMTKEKLNDVKYPEITSRDVNVRGSDNYNVYGVEDKVLFDTDKSELRPTAKQALEQVSASINQRYGKNDVRIMGFADARGDKGYNKELSEKRADAVKNWLEQNGKIDAARISVEPMGESDPVATNATAAGRQQNRRVEIAVATK